jgi:hypothetical protein
VFDVPIWNEINNLYNFKFKSSHEVGIMRSGNNYVHIFTEYLNRILVGINFGSRVLGHSIETHFAKAYGKIKFDYCISYCIMFDIYWDILDIVNNFKKIRDFGLVIVDQDFGISLYYAMHFIKYRTMFIYVGLSAMILWFFIQ